MSHIPPTNYVVDETGEAIFVQLRVQDWEAFVNMFNQLEALTQLQVGLKDAFQEVKAIKKGEEVGTQLNDFLDEL